jgi:hypothetical protein
MRPREQGSAPVIRLWWALPLALGVVTAVAFVAVVLPALASGPGVPAQLIVHRSAAPTVSPSPHSGPSRASPESTHSTTVVRPEQPVVRESDDRHEAGRGDASGGADDR